MNKILFRILFAILFCSCNKKDNNVVDTKKVYTEKYIQNMTGSRMWHHQYHTQTPLADTTYYLDDTIGSISLLNDSTIYFSLLGGNISIVAADAERLYFYDAFGLMSSHPTDFQTVYYYPANDNILASVRNSPTGAEIYEDIYISFK